MIHLKFMGHIKTSLGTEEMDVPKQEVTVGELFDLLASKSPSGGVHGFSEHNTLLVVNDEEVFSASSRSGRVLNDGDSVLLVPFSHGG